VPHATRRVTPAGGARVEAGTPSAAWALLLARQTTTRGPGSAAPAAPKSRSGRASGASQFGLAHPRVLAALCALPHAVRCARFAAWPGARPAVEPLVRLVGAQRAALSGKLAIGREACGLRHVA
jgi:hypothetical protein